jgi:long-chain acyl-CoA synthetase
LNYLAAARITATDIYMMQLPFFHIGGYLAFAYLAMGRPAVITNFAADAAVDIISAENVTTFFCVATMLPRLIASVTTAGSPISTVRQVEYGGAPMPQEIIKEASAAFGGADLIQAWGMTELGPGTWLTQEDHREALTGRRVDLLRSCGRQSVLSQVVVANPDGSPVPRDNTTVGEILHKGPNNMLGFWNNIPETEAMLKDGWIHSGDAATWDEDGYVFIVDRIKSMIICGGENIFPAEIERVLGNHPAIAEVAVVGTPDPEWGEVVKAVVVRRPGAQLSELEVTKHVEAELGSYKKPRIVQFVQELPMTPTGKIDRKALRNA